MIESLDLENIGPAEALTVHWARRLNLITGDNGLGKSFLLDIAWWVLTGSWANSMAMPNGHNLARIKSQVRSGIGKQQRPLSTFNHETREWAEIKTKAGAGIVVYVRVDGGFSVWDSCRNDRGQDKTRPVAYHFGAKDVWAGLDIDGQRVCEGLERDWVNWQKGNEPQFAALKDVLQKLSPNGENLQPGPPRRLFLGEGRDRPTLVIAGQNVPVAFASAGIRRILALAYFLVWAWFEHRVAAQLLGKQPEREFTILFDEPETHLHPRWQRTVLPSLMATLDGLPDAKGAAYQLLVATHSPLILASLEGVFDQTQDDLMQLTLQAGRVCLSQGHWANQGDVSSWLESDVFGLEQARSLEAEQAIDAAEAFMRGEKSLPAGLKTKAAIHQRLQQLLPAHDEFWPRWLIESDSLPRGRGVKRSKS